MTEENMIQEQNSDPQQLRIRELIQSSVAVLVGKTLWRCTHAADLAAFQFGSPREVLKFDGERALVGEYALHVQCPWHIAEAAKIIVGSGDVLYPADRVSLGEEKPSADKQLNRRDALIETLFQNGRTFKVESISAKPGLGLEINFYEGLALEVFPNDSSADEHWRLLRPNFAEPHFVVTGNGIEQE